jgi:glycosyltransferase involved in cell wall biosynthesis
MMPNYLLVTPIRDESKNLEQLRESTLQQHARPVVWVIVDSFSEDGSYNAARSMFQEYGWIHVIGQKKRHEIGYSHKNFAQAVNEGYEYGKGVCVKKGYSYEFIGKTDATPVLSPDYFEKLLIEMEKDPKLMITCGVQRLSYRGNIIDVKPTTSSSMMTFNDIRLYRAEFFERMGGYPIAPSPDTILLIKAKNNNFKVKIVDQAFFIKPRLGGSKIGIWKGNILKGVNMYISGYHPLLMLINSLILTTKYPPHYQILPLLIGYSSSIIRKTKRIDDKEVLEYYGKTRLNEIIINLFR